MMSSFLSLEKENIKTVQFQECHKTPKQNCQTVYEKSCKKVPQDQCKNEQVKEL